MVEETTVRRATGRAWAGLAVLALPTLLVPVDASVLFLALPRLAEDLRPSTTEQLWIIDVYGFMVAGFLVTMGTVADRIGRRKTLLIGTAVFGVASAAAAFSTTPGMLIASRAVLGIAGAALAPCALSLVRATFEDPKQRGAAVAVVMSCFMGGQTLGPIIGGALLQHFWWGSVFLIGVPVAVVVLIAAPLLVPEYRAPDPGRLDLVSVALSLASILPFVYGLTELARHGFQVVSTAAAVFGLAIGVVFVRRQRRARSPLLDLGLFASRTFRGTMVLSTTAGAITSGMLLLVNIYLQTVAGFTPLAAGLLLVPTAVAMIVVIGLSQGLVRRFRPAWIMAAGSLLSGVGYLVITQVGATGGTTLVIVGWGLAMAGLGTLTGLGYDIVLDSAPAEKAGSASATVEAGGQLGNAAGIAVLGSIAGIVYRAAIAIPPGTPHDVGSAAQDGITGAVAAAQQLPEPARGAVLDAAGAAFASSLHGVALVGIAGFLAMAGYTLKILRHRPARG